VPMNDTIVVFGKQVYYKIGTIKPGETFEIGNSSDRSLDRSLSSFLQEKQKTFPAMNYYANQNENISRVDLIREMMFHDSDTSGQESIPSRAHHDIDLSGQLALGRPMLVATIDRPGTQLVLKDNNNEPKIDQTTLLRVILPIKKEGDAGKPK
jgi:hypothetical protein